MAAVNNATLGLVADSEESFVANITSATLTLVKAGNATLNGIIINSHSSGTVTIYDHNVNTYVGAVKFGTMTLSTIATTGERFITFFGARFSTGILVYCTGTVDISVMYR